MAVTVVLNGVSYSIPEPGNDAWGQDLTDYFVAQASGLLQKAGGTFTLTAEVDFGTTYGLKSAYFKSRGTSPASAGQVRLANLEGIYWRNAANGADLALKVNASDLLEFNGTAIQPAGDYISALTGDVTATGPGSVAASLVATSNATITTLSALTSAANLSTVGTITSGVWSGTTIAINKGGTGQTTANAALNALLPSQGSQSGKVLGTNGTDSSWVSVLSNPMSTDGDIIYGASSGAATRLAGNTTTTKQYLSQTGDGVNSAAPAWATLAASDIGSGTLAKARGGTAQDNSSLTFPSSGTIPAITPTNHGVVISSATAAANVTGAGTAGQVLTSNGASADPTFQAIPSAYFFGYMGGANANWPTTGTTLANPTGAKPAAASLTTVLSSGLGTVAQLNTGGTAYYPGITVTPTATGKYLVTATVSMEQTTSGQFAVAGLYDDTSGVMIDNKSFRAAAANGSSILQLMGIVSLTASTAKTLVIQTAASANTATIVASNANVDRVITWTVQYIGT